MATVLEPTLVEGQALTATALAERFGEIPLKRILFDPLPGTATVADAERIIETEGRLVELVDGVLVEKAMGAFEGVLACYLAHLLWDYLEEHDIGIAGGADTMLRILPKQVRIPDVAFIAWEKLPGRKFPRKRVPSLVPDLAVEVLSEDNSETEMDGKLHDYFTSGVQLVWYIDPEKHTVEVYTTPVLKTTLGENDVLRGGDVLPGLEIKLRAFFHCVEREDKA
jgi:Uma2 family endonuclease